MSKYIYGVVIAIFTILILLNYKYKDIINENKITLTATDEQNELAEGSEIWIKSIIIDGKQYSAREIFTEGWIEKEELLGWRAYDQYNELQNQITGFIPDGKEYRILFEANKWRGKVKISFIGQEILFDCYKDSENGEILCELPADFIENSVSKPGSEAKKYFFLLCWILAVALLVVSLIGLYLLLKRKDLLIPGKSLPVNRKIWADLLRIFAMFQVVLLHATNEGYISLFSDLSNWYNFLYLNCFTTCAVPLFFMISGNFIIRQEENFLYTVWYRIKKILIPLFLWSVVYIFIRKWYLNEDINIIQQIGKIGKEPQYYHLWFIYTLLGVYLASPVISWIYYNIEKKMLYYTAIIFGILPFLLKTLETATGYSVGISFLYMLFPELILFVLGKWISDHRKKLFKKWYIWLITGFTGYAMVTLLTYYYSLKYNTPYKGFFSNYGTIPLFIMYVSIYIIFLQSEPQFSKLNQKLKTFICLVSESCMDIYFIHMLWYIFLEGKNFFGLFQFSIKAESIRVRMVTAVVCFLFSFLSSQIIKSIRQCIVKLEKPVTEK